MVNLLYLMWTLLKEKNKRVFNDVERSNQTINFFFVYILL